MSNEIQTTNNYFLPTSFDQAERFAEKIACSALCPNAFKNKPGDVFIAMQLGAEVGLSPMAAIQNIAVINGRPAIWGDALLAIVKAHHHCLSVREWIDGSIDSNNAIAYCGITRKGQKEEIRSFSMAQAKKAGLLNKQGVWLQYPERMLQMRARGFCARDVFPDALRGLQCAEEVQDYIDVVVEPSMPHNMKLLEGQPISQSFIVETNIVENYLNEIKNSESWDELKEIYKVAKEAVKGDKDASNKISKATKDQQDILRVKKEKEESLNEPENEPETKSDHSEFLAAYEGKTA